MKAWVVMGLVLGANVFATGTYKGTGEMRNPGKADEKYDVELVVKELKNGDMDVTDTFTMPGQKPMSFHTIFRFEKNGTVKITRDGVAIGCGYCVPAGKDNHWCDYKEQTEFGPLHVNMYYSGKDEKLLRMGDIIKLDGVQTWNENLVKQ